MPFLPSQGTNLYYRLEGREHLPVLILSHSLGADHGMWDPQVPALLDHFRVLRYDTRGHGASQASAGEYSIPQLAADVLTLADGLGIDKFAFCGLSLGGMTGMWVAAHNPQRITRLILANTSPKFADPSIMEGRRKTVLESGMKPIEAAVMGRFFMPATLDANPTYVASTRTALLATNPTGYAGCCAAVRDLDNRAILSQIVAPTLVISGEHDQSTPWLGHGDLLASAIPRTKAVLLASAHLSNIERPREFTSELLNFLVDPPADSWVSGMKVRRAVLGDAYVDRATSSANAFNREFQEMITKSAWGSIWTRPGLDFRTRRLLVLAMTASLGRWEEFRLHVRTGLQHELELCDLKEVLMQVAVYAGVPCANAAFHAVSDELRQQ